MRKYCLPAPNAKKCYSKRPIPSLAALFLSVILLQLLSGGVAPLDALTGLKQGFSKAQIGILGSSHFLGFFIGCWWASRIMGSIGHSRAFAFFTSMGAIGMLGHTILIDPMTYAHNESSFRALCGGMLNRDPRSSSKP